MKLQTIIDYVESEEVGKKFENANFSEQILSMIRADETLNEFVYEINICRQEELLKQLLFRVEGMCHYNYNKVNYLDAVISMYAYLVKAIEIGSRHSTKVSYVLNWIADKQETHRLGASNTIQLFYAPQIVKLLLR